MTSPAAPAFSARMLDWAGQRRRPWLVLCLICLLLWLPGFFSLPPSDRDESRFAQATKQMIETGNLVEIRNGLVARNQKPIGIYWAQLPFAAAARSFGVARANPIWPYRLPSLLGGLAAVLATYGFGRDLVGRRAALLGAVLLAATGLLTVEVHMAKTDALLLAVTTIAMFILARARLAPAAVGRFTALGFWAALGAGILIKGPITPLVCGLASLALAVADRRAGPPRWLRALRPATGLWLTLAIVLPWFIAIGIATHGAFFSQSVGGDLAGKLAAADDSHGAPFGYHLALLPLLLFAAGAPTLCAATSVWKDRARPEIRVLIAWIVPAWIVFELVATKLPHYTLPLYPPLALLAARFMVSDDTAPRWLRAAACALAILVTLGVGAAALALPFVAIPALGAPDLLGVPSFALALAAAVLLVRVFPDPRRTAWIMLGAAPLLYAALLGLELPSLRALWIAPRVEAALRNAPPAPFGALGFAEPSLMFLCGTATRLFNAPPPAARFLIAAPGNLLLVDDRQIDALRALVAAQGGTLRSLAQIDGYNYSHGRRVDLTLVGAARSGNQSAQRMK